MLHPSLDAKCDIVKLLIHSTARLSPMRSLALRISSVTQAGATHHHAYGRAAARSMGPLGGDGPRASISVRDALLLTWTPIKPRRNNPNAEQDH
jgi:hypothetical protein